MSGLGQIYIGLQQMQVFVLLYVEGFCNKRKSPLLNFLILDWACFFEKLLEYDPELDSSWSYSYWKQIALRSTVVSPSSNGPLKTETVAMHKECCKTSKVMGAVHGFYVSVSTIVRCESTSNLNIINNCRCAKASVIWTSLTWRLWDPVQIADAFAWLHVYGRV